jgi:hypothetical protein
MILQHKRLLTRYSELLLWLAAALCFGFIAWNKVLAMQAESVSVKQFSQLQPLLARKLLPAEM